jgi:hypothetical protein
MERNQERMTKKNRINESKRQKEREGWMDEWTDGYIDR